MSNGVYGTKRPADVSISDIDIYMHFTPDRNTATPLITKLASEEILMENTTPDSINEIIGGFYTLKLPKELFSTKGFYTLLIRPKQIRTRITDIGVLSAQPSVKGIVFDMNAVDEDLKNRFENGSLVGYRIEYLNDEGISNKLRNLFRIITSNNRCEGVNQNLADSSQKAIRYRFNDGGSLSFCTVTPNSTGSTKPNITPFIGGVNQQVILTNTFFDPVMVEIEMVDYDVNDLAIGIFGNQTKSIEDGIFTMYDFENEIYKQYTIYEVKDSYTDEPQFEVREEKDEIDGTKDFEGIKDTNG